MRHTVLALAAALFSLLLVALGQAAPAVAGPTPIGLFTIVEGEVTVIRAALKFRAAEGLAVQADDIVQTAGAAPLARIELADGGSIDLGPATAVLMQPRYAEPVAERAALVYVMQGWVKLGGRRLSAASTRADLTELNGAAVLHVSENALQVFVESGRARLQERFDGRAAQTHAMAEGETFLRRAADTGVVTRRPVPQLLQALPRPFTDALPLRAAQFRDRAVAAPAGDDIAYADVADWINGERALRPAFVQRWKAKVRDPLFWKPLVAELADHPEWHRVMYPEKYAAAAAAAAKRRAAQLASASGALQPAAAPAEPHRLVVERSAETTAGLPPAAQ